MPHPCIVVTIEGLGTNLLGCYGGAISRTPQLDSFAGTATVFDQCWLQSLGVVDSLNAILSGSDALFAADKWHGLAQQTTSDGSPRNESALDLCKFYESRNLPTRFITDAPELAEHPFLERFTEASVVDFEASDASAESLEQTRIANLFQYAITRYIESAVENEDAVEGLLWIHATGLSSPWDAPYELRTIPCDEGDPTPSADTQPPRLSITPDSDPDLLFSAICGAAAQAAAIDYAWSFINELIEEVCRLGQGDTSVEPVVVLMGVGGYPMGEHVMVGHVEGPLFAERLHVPLIIRPTRLNVGRRYPQIVQPWQIGRMLLEAIECTSGAEDVSVVALQAKGSESSSSTAEFGAGDNDLRWDESVTFWNEAPLLPNQWPEGHRLAWAAREDELALITAAWSSRLELRRGLMDEPMEALTRAHEDAIARWQVFVNPDDRWQQNDVADRVEKIVGQLNPIAKRLQAALYSSDGRLDLEKLQLALESLLTDELVSPIH